MKHTFIFSCTDNGGGHHSFEVRATDKQEAIRKGMKTTKKFACGDICGDWECKLKRRIVYERRLWSDYHSCSKMPEVSKSEILRP